MTGGDSKLPSASRRPRFGWSRALALLGLALVIVIVASSVRIAIAVHRVTPKTGPGDVLSLVFQPQAEAGSLAQRISSNQRINVLLMAYGGVGGDDPNFTDTMIVVSIRPGSRQATVLSLPRYLWVKIPAPPQGDVAGKLYAAYALGASQNSEFLRPQWLSPTGPGDLAATTVSETIGQPIDYWVAIDASGLEAVIDALGGVRVTVPEVLDDWNYPDGDTGRTMHIHFDTGAQLLDGRRAVEYARSRLSTSEADRTQRQALVLLSILKELRAPHVGLGLVWSIVPLEDGLRTNLRPLEIREFAQLVTTIRVGDVKQINIGDSDLLQPKTLETAPILVPRDGTYRALQAYIEGQLP
jgi:LCP family protein required for cell wall assembly